MRDHLAQEVELEKKICDPNTLIKDLKGLSKAKVTLLDCGGLAEVMAW